MTTTLIPGKHRNWTITPRTGTGPEDRYTVISEPIPADDNPAGEIEDGQFSSWAHALDALNQAESIDDGGHALEVTD
jgi:hypothetical protein